ncbi:MAG: fumarate hydratase, partial [Bacteroidales bacterium]
MPTNPFKYQEMFPLGKDKTKYRLLSSKYVRIADFEGRKILKIDPRALRTLSREAFHDVEFMLRREHNRMVARILDDPEASDNDKAVALIMLQNACVACEMQLPFCQDTGTAMVVGFKGQDVYTGGRDEEQLSHGVYDTFTRDNLRYSQNAPLDMYDEKNTGCNLPAQISLHAVDGGEYLFVFVAKGGGSANKTYFFQETKALLTPGKLE